MKNSIFEKNIEKSNIKKIYLNKENSIWYFEDEFKKRHTLAPAKIVEMTISPLVAGVDKAIFFACKNKNIDSKNGLYLYFSEEEFIDCDFKLEFYQNFFDGWIYNVFSEKIKLDFGQKVWACSYLKLYYSEPPKVIYLKIESI